MNMFFGAIDIEKPIRDRFRRIGDHLEDTYGQSPTADASDSVLLGVLTDGGRLVGTHRQGSITLSLLGFLHHPLPGWNEAEAPVDSPSLAARYLLTRYLSLGDRFLDGVWGRFCVAVVDTAEERVLLASDSYGHGQIFLHQDEHAIAFGTHLYTLARSLGDDLQLDRSLEDFFLLYGFLPRHSTMYRGISCLPAGTLLVWDRGVLRTTAIPCPAPWSEGIKDLARPDLREEDFIDLLHTFFLDALRAQLPTENRVAVLLGGFDSALVAAGLRALGKEVETFSFHYRDAKYNQPHTDTLARHLGIKHNWIAIEPSTVAQGLHTYADFFNTPTNWANYVIQSQHAVQSVRQRGFRYCYTGDGCDGMFQGYPGTYKRLHLIERLGIWPTWLVKALVQVLSIPALERGFGRPITVALALVRSAGREHPERHYLTFPIFDRSSLEQLRPRQAAQQQLDPDKLAAELAAPFKDMDPIRLGYIGKNDLAPGKIKLRGCADSSGLVLASPYLHAGMGELARRAPNEFLRPNAATQDIGKYILSRMADEKRMLPRSIIFQPKLGAPAAPLEDWFDGPMRQDALDLMQYLPFEPSHRYLESLLRHKLSEKLYKRLVYKDLVTLSHGISLLATYASFCQAAAPRRPS